MGIGRLERFVADWHNANSTEKPAHHHVGLDLHAQLLEPVHFLLDDGLGQTELGDAVDQHR